jgi:hypothetical protein
VLQAYLRPPSAQPVCGVHCDLGVIVGATSIRAMRVTEGKLAVSDPKIMQQPGVRSSSSR